MTDLAALIAEIEAASEGTSYLDREIWRSLGVGWASYTHSATCAHALAEHIMRHAEHLEWTMRSDLCFYLDHPLQARVEIRVASREYEGFARGADCHPRAICAAALRARMGAQ